MAGVTSVVAAVVAAAVAVAVAAWVINWMKRSVATLATEGATTTTRILK
jgi:hypothetical protein